MIKRINWAEEKKVTAAFGPKFKFKWPPMNQALQRKRRSELNKRKYKSEIWFLDALKAARISEMPRRNWCIANRVFADFVWLDRKVIIEIDGSAHAGREAQDKRRDAFLQHLGYRIHHIKFGDTEKASRILTLIFYSVEREATSAKILNELCRRARTLRQEKS